MNLGCLISEMEKQLRLSKTQVVDYMHLPEVSSFVERREADLKLFKNAISDYKLSTSVLSIQQVLRERFPNESKIFGGMCLNGAGYFALTDKVQNAIEIENTALERKYYEEEKEEHICNPDYDILDED